MTVDMCLCTIVGIMSVLFSTKKTLDSDCRHAFVDHYRHREHVVFNMDQYWPVIVDLRLLTIVGIMGLRRLLSLPAAAASASSCSAVGGGGGGGDELVHEDALQAQSARRCLNEEVQVIGSFAGTEHMPLT